MAWNQPGNNGQDRDPWGSSDGNSGNSDGNNSNNGRQPNNNSGGDIFQKINIWLGQLSRGGGGRRGSSGGSLGPNIGRGAISIAVVLGVALWAGSGFYTIKEGEVGVVTRLGKNITGLDVGQKPWVAPGLNWRPMFIDQVTEINISRPRVLATSGVMLTADENVANVEMNVIYQVFDPSKYLFSVTNSDESIRQATDSALRAVIGKYTLDRILTDGRTIVSEETKAELEKIIARYDLGVVINSVNFQQAKPPVAVQAAFNDAIAAREDEERYKVSSVKYSKQKQPEAQGRARRLTEDARAYREKTILEAEGDVARFVKILPEYKRAPEITRQRLYLETMEQVLGRTDKVLLEQNDNNLTVLPLERLTNRNKPTSVVETQSVKVVEVPAYVEQKTTIRTAEKPTPMGQQNRIVAARESSVR